MQYITNILNGAYMNIGFKFIYHSFYYRFVALGTMRPNRDKSLSDNEIDYMLFITYGIYDLVIDDEA